MRGEGKKKAQKAPAGTLLALSVLSIAIGTVTAGQLLAVGPGLGPLHGLGGHRREEFGERWSCWRMETAAGAAAFPRARLLPPAGLQPGDFRLRVGMAIVAQATPKGSGWPQMGLR